MACMYCNNNILFMCSCAREEVSKPSLNLEVEPKPVGKIGRPQKASTELDDILSAGRKRANVLKPIIEGDLCEWAGLKDVGGGPVPMVGCKDNRAKSVHHGPDKSVLNNSMENIHKICNTCHNRWHTLNDPFYSIERPPAGLSYLPVEAYESKVPVRSNPEDILGNEFDWEARRITSRKNKKRRAGVE